MKDGTVRIDRRGIESLAALLFSFADMSLFSASVSERPIRDSFCLMLFASSSSNVNAGVEDDDVVAVLGIDLACLGGGGGGGGEVDPSPCKILDGMDFTLDLQTLPPKPSGESPISKRPSKVSGRHRGRDADSLIFNGSPLTFSFWTRGDALLCPCSSVGSVAIVPYLILHCDGQAEAKHEVS